MIGVRIHYVLKEILGRKNRSLLMLAGLTLGITFLLCVNALANAYDQAASVPLQQLGADLTVQKSNGPIPNKFEGAVLPCANNVISEPEKIRNIPGVEQVTSALLLWVFDSGQNNAGDFKMVLGIEPDSNIGPGKLKGGIQAGRYLTSSDHNKAMVDKSYASAKGIKLGDVLHISGRDFPVIGIVTTPSTTLLGTTNVYISLADAQEIASKAPEISHFQHNDVNVVFVKSDPARLASVQSDIQKALPGVTVSTPQSFLGMMGGVAAAAKLIARLGSLIAVFAAGAMAMRTTASSIMERKRDIAIMKAVGWSAANIRNQIMSENLLLGLSGGLLGLIVSYGFTLLLRGQLVEIPLPWELDPYPHFYLTSSAEKFLKVPLNVNLSLTPVILALILAVVITLITTLVFARRITNIKPSEVLRYD